MSPDPNTAGGVGGSKELRGPLFFGYPQGATDTFALQTKGPPPPPPTPCTAVTWNAPTPASPQAPGTQATFSGTAAGCPNPVYDFWVQPPGRSWTMLPSYSTASSPTCNTTRLSPAPYRFDDLAS